MEAFILAAHNSVHKQKGHDKREKICRGVSGEGAISMNVAPYVLLERNLTRIRCNYYFTAWLRRAPACSRVPSCLYYTNKRFSCSLGPWHNKPGNINQQNLGPRRLLPFRLCSSSAAYSLRSLQIVWVETLTLLLPACRPFPAPHFKIFSMPS